MAEVTRIVGGALETNCYLVVGPDRDAVLIDPGAGIEPTVAAIEARRARLRAVLCTHAHADHVGAATAVVERYAVPLYLHSADARLLRRANIYRTVLRGEEPIAIPAIDEPLDGVERLRLGALEVRVLHTHGHTAGSVCFEIDGELFTGDTLFAAHTGRTDLPEGDREKLEASFELLGERYPARTTFHPGHGEAALLGDVLPRAAELPELRG